MSDKVQEDSTVEIDLCFAADEEDDDDLEVAIIENDAANIERIALRCSAVSFHSGFVFAMAEGRIEALEQLVGVAESRRLSAADVDRLVGAGFGPACERGRVETVDALARLGILGAWPTATLEWDASYQMLRRGSLTSLDAAVIGHIPCSWTRGQQCGHAAVAARLLAAGAVPTTPAVQLVLNELGDSAMLARWVETPELAAALEGVPGYRIGYDAGYRAGRLEAASE